MKKLTCQRLKHEWQNIFLDGLDPDKGADVHNAVEKGKPQKPVAIIEVGHDVTEHCLVRLLPAKEEAQIGNGSNKCPFDLAGRIDKQSCGLFLDNGLYLDKHRVIVRLDHARRLEIRLVRLGSLRDLEHRDGCVGQSHKRASISRADKDIGIGGKVAGLRQQVFGNVGGVLGSYRLDRLDLRDQL